MDVCLCRAGEGGRGVQVGRALTSICRLGEEHPTKSVWRAIVEGTSEGKQTRKRKWELVVQLAAGGSRVGTWTATEAATFRTSPP